MYDLIIIGAGPAGITATVYAARQKMDFLVITKDIGGQTAWSGSIENYTGYQFIEGPDLVAKFEEHMKDYDVNLRKNEEVTELVKKGDTVSVKTDSSSYEAKAVIIASGKRSKELNVPGEEEFKNKGLTYCATCDGPLFAGKDVAVVGGGNSALDAVLKLTKIAKRIYLINVNASLGGEIVLRDKVLSSDNVTALNNARTVAVEGDKFVSGIRVKTREGEKAFPVQGIFVEIGLVPNTGFVKDAIKNDKGEIAVNCSCETAVPGIFAAGDVTSVPAKQIIVAAGEGSKATLSVFGYLAGRK